MDGLVEHMNRKLTQQSILSPLPFPTTSLYTYQTALTSFLVCPSSYSLSIPPLLNQLSIASSTLFHTLFNRYINPGTLNLNNICLS